jgi:putative hydrolase of the HAD superfamily
MTAAFLVDVYETLVHCDFTARTAALAGFSGADPELFGRGLLALGLELDLGRISIEEALTVAVRDSGGVMRPGLYDDFRLAYSEDARLFPDAIPFLRAARERGIPVAVVSNCSTDTRPMLEAMGVLDLVDAAVLSCEIGHAKPSAEIYARALASLGVQASEAVFVDDQLRYCDGAAAAGVTAVQIARSGAQERDGFRVVTSLMELLA